MSGGCFKGQCLSVKPRGQVEAECLVGCSQRSSPALSERAEGRTGYGGAAEQQATTLPLLIACCGEGFRLQGC